jgi:hypothetical protein
VNEALNQLAQKPDYSRVKKVPVTMDMLLEVFQTGQVLRAEIVQGIPPGSQITRHQYDFATGFYWLTIQNDAFEPVERGKAIPVLPIVCRQIPEGYDLIAHADRHREWSEKTFGPADRAKGVVAHIRKELEEIEADPTDVMEWIDVITLAIDGAWRSAGATAMQIAHALRDKLARNEKRKWPDWRTLSPDQPSEHIEEAPATEKAA